VLVSELDVTPEHILRVFENTVLKRIFVLERGIVNGVGKYYIMKNFIIVLFKYY
jgi:hypothetical protein